MHKQKSFDIKVIEKKPDGGRIIISTGVVDRDKDRVMPLGAKIDDYLRNPVVQWSHNYFDPFATIGRTKTLEVNTDGIVADFELRPAASEADPQHIIRLLWDGDWIRAASIGFMPDMAATAPNDFGGLDFNSWSLLEWSLVAIPANQSALRLAAEQHPKAFAAYTKAIEKSGRVLSAANEKKIKSARDNLDEVLAQIAEEDEDDDGKSFMTRQKRAKAEAPRPGTAMAWVRRMEAVSDLGTQQLYAVFRQYSIDVPKDATTLRCDDDGNLVEAPDPDAGKSITRKEVTFVPPIAYTDDSWGDDATYSISANEREDADLVKGTGGEWEVSYLGEVLDQIPLAKGTRRRRIVSLGLRALTQRGFARAKAIIRRKASAVPAADDTFEDAERLLAQLDAIKSAVKR